MTRTALQRFHDSYVMVPESGCWLWIKAIRRPGYGAMTVNRRCTTAHRFSYENLVGPIPPGMFVCHKCDVRCCVRPDHLFVGTREDNGRDMKLKGRGRKAASCYLGGRPIPLTLEARLASVISDKAVVTKIKFFELR